MWTIVSAKDRNQGLANHAMVFVILCLYVLDIAFIDNGQNFWTVFSALSAPLPEYKRTQWLLSVSGLVSTLAADSSLIWRCWIVWRQHWRIVLLHIQCLFTATASSAQIWKVELDSVKDSSPQSFLQIVVNKVWELVDRRMSQKSLPMLM
ncbi:hypothetical protein EDD18DRAFT_1112453 [Armillaria luteobubalina]|uniref:Uncharacterized protein n=1 Tax=Armillaria luteobubalina TaxID=153913 RepID=A0AA39UHM6_9AGAR|nr:hypothetical protein EDD18DRAFT_1112453 [Armillaria luteobubalina]